MYGFPVNRGLHAETEKQRDISLTWRPLATHGLLFIMTELWSGGGVAAYLRRKNPAVTVEATAIKRTNASVKVRLTGDGGRSCAP